MSDSIHARQARSYAIEKPRPASRCRLSEPD